MLWAKLFITALIMMPLGFVFVYLAKEAEGVNERLYEVCKVLAVILFYGGAGLAVGSLITGVWLA